MDENSSARGFKYIFGIEMEEVAIRFYRMFVEPQGMPRMVYVDVYRFMAVTKMMCQANFEEIGALAFRFYDYDQNGSIGSVDILNFIRHLDQPKIAKI